MENQSARLAAERQDPEAECLESPGHQVRAEDPLGASELHALGLHRMEVGDLTGAIEYLWRAVALRPGIPAFHVDLAEVYRSLGDLTRAEGCCHIALKLRPDYPEGWNTLGLVLQGTGRREEAIDSFRHALSTRPEMTAAL